MKMHQGQAITTSLGKRKTRVWLLTDSGGLFFRGRDRSQDYIVPAPFVERIFGVR